MAATVITLSQLAGEKPDASDASLPAATTMTVPFATAVSMAACEVKSHAPGPPNDILITSAGLALAGMPDTAPPDAQTMASAISEVVPPHSPSTRTGSTLALKATPATPLLLLVTAAMVPATWVPCQLESSATVVESPQSPVVSQSPSSFGLASRPLPSRAAAA